VNRRIYWFAGLWSLSAAGLIFLAWWRDSTLNLPGPRSDALALWLQLAAWGLTFLTAGALGWLVRAERSPRRVAVVVAATVAAFGLLVVASIGALNVLASYFSTLSYSELLVLALIFVLGPSAVLFLAAWLIRGLQLRRAPVTPESSPARENKF
jgi:hypothetical protein